MEYKKQASKDQEVYEDLVQGSTYKKTVSPGSWIRVGAEGYFSGTAPEKVYTYVTQGSWFTTDYDEVDIRSVEDIWVDGRYINKWNYFEEGAVFSDHPTADIMIRNMQYIDGSGTSQTGDITFMYNEEQDVWEAKFEYHSGYSIPGGTLPDELILTQEEVAALGVDRNTNTKPEHGFIYDSSVAPGTPF